jgi:hypothetical protein
MKEKDIEKKLLLLKEVTPSSRRTQRMKVKLLKEIEGNTTSNVSNSRYKNFVRPKYFMFLVLLLLLGIIFTISTQKNVQPFLYSARIALADNHYVKTKLAFEEAQMELNSSQQSDKTSIQPVVTATTTTNEYISHLHLQGEKGKYTAEQCKELYQEYTHYLSMLKSRLHQQKQYSYEAQISQYQEQAKARLAYYKT